MVWVEETLKIFSFQPPCHRRGKTQQGFVCFTANKPGKPDVGGRFHCTLSTLRIISGSR